MGRPPAVLSSVRMVLAALSLLCCLGKLKVVFLSSMKNCVRILMRIPVNMCIVFGRVAIFTALILLTHEDGRSFHFFSQSRFNFFLQRLKVFMIQDFLLLDYSYLQDILYSWAIVKGAVPLISFSGCSLFLYWRVTAFCMLVLYLATLLKLFINYEFSSGIFRVPDIEYNIICK